MIPTDRFALNRIACPGLGLEEFFDVAREAGLTRVELRNDLPGGRVTDALPPSRAAELAAGRGVEIITINALQKFNVKALAGQVTSELQRLLELASALRCRAVVLCPNNDRGDRRDAAARRRETVEALASLGPLFAASGVLGYVEPLGFAESSLASASVAAEAVRESGQSCYRILYDTFHHYLGPDTAEDVEKKLDVSLVGLVHASGVEAELDKGAMKDGHRVLVTNGDRMGNVAQIARLVARGYTGDVSLEPFSSEVQQLDRKAFLKAARETIGILTR